ncbi:MAG: hypothetical protein HY200_00345 [Nitrospirae bacterium]|nr:hypothetical protein [Nitrospirota bacterium]
MKTLRKLSFFPEVPLVFFSFFLNFFWEIVQSPLYNDIQRKTYQQILISRLHCTFGDLFIILVAYWVVSWFTEGRGWILSFHFSNLAGFTLLGLGYTLLSEWINVDIRSAWGYSPLMPRLPWIGSGLTPVLQWVIVPPVIAGMTRRFLSIRKPSGINHEIG